MNASSRDLSGDGWERAIPLPAVLRQDVVRRALRGMVSPEAGRRVLGRIMPLFYPLGHLCILQALRRDDVLLATYPKAGMNWLCFLLANFLTQSKGASNPKELLTRHRALVSIGHPHYQTHPRPCLIRYAYGYAAEVGSPRHVLHALRHTGARFIQTHACYQPAFAGIRTVYLTRDPRDVLVSRFHYQRLVQPGYPFNLSQFVDRELNRANIDGCDWSTHLEGWTSRHRKLLLIKYEDLKRDPYEVMTRLLEFSGVPYSPAHLQAAIEQSSFEKMRTAEVETGLPFHPRANPATERRFVRKGKVGSASEELEAHEIRAIEDRFRGLMGRLGYV